MTKNLIVYNASAGSGKTFVLALEYIALCLSSDDDRYFKRILAITFTNKAAHELKERIILFLADLAGSNPDPIKLRELRNRMSLSEQAIQIRAARIHETLLHNYGEIHISTIDSFVLSILRGFSKELGMAFDFDVELDSTRVQDLLVESIMSQIGRDKFITKQLARLVTQNLDEGQAWDPKRNMREAIDHLMDEDSIAYREQLAAMGESALQDQLEKLSKERKGVLESIKTAQSHVREGMIARGFEISHFNGGSRGFITFAFKDLRLKTAPSAAQIKKVEEGKFSSPGAKKEGIADAVDDFGTKHIAPQFWKTLEALSKFALIDNLYRNRLSLVLALRLQNLLKKFEDDEGLSVIKDNNFKIAALIADNPTPFIYERVGERYQHFLIDEFQDTSILQWRNMLPLVDASLSYGNKNFLVGDVKQSIYRWRGGEANQMVDLPKVLGSNNNRLLRQIEENLARNLDDRNLDENYRSSRAVIAFNNDLFKHLSHSLPEHYEASYANVKQGEQREIEGYVELKALEKDSTLEDSFDSMMEAITLAESDGYFGADICILSRSNKDGRRIAKHLESNGYSVSSPDSLLLSGHADVQLLMSFVHVLSNQAALDSELYIIYRLLDLHSRLDEYHRWAMNAKGRNTSTERIEELTSALGLDWSSERYADKDVYHCLDLLSQDLALDGNDAYLLELMNAALSYVQDKDSTLIGFYEFWQTKSKSLAVKGGSNRNSIQLMTIHKSKGLQFPVVIIPFLNWTSGKNTKKKEWTLLEESSLEIGLLNINQSLADTVYAEILEQEKNKSKLDELNVLYVASTRAEDRMHIHIVDTPRQGIAQTLLSYMKLKSQDDSLYQIGKLSPRKSKNSDYQSTQQLNGYERQERSELLSFALSKDRDMGSQQAMGQLLHRTLEQSSNIEEAQAIMDSLIGNTAITSEDAQSLKEALIRVYDIEEKQGWTRKGLKRRKEIEVLSEDGKIYRMDKVLIDSDLQKVTVIDYKTGGEDEKNSVQMEGYLSILKKMGWLDIEGFLLYTASGKLEKI